MMQNIKPNPFRLLGLLFLLSVVACQFYLYGRILIHPRGVYWAMSDHWEKAQPCTFNENVQTFQNAWKDLETTYNPKPDFFINTYGLAQDLLDVKIIRDQQQTVVKLNNGYVTLWDSSPSENQAQILVEFLKTLQEHNIQVLYVQAPHKICKYDPELPYNLQDSLNPFADFLLKSLTEVGIECLDAREFYQNDPSGHYANFYWSDHHWKDDYVFKTFQEIASILQEKGICSVEDFLLDRASYHAAKGPLGESELIRVGKWYAKSDSREILELNENFAQGVEQEISPEEKEFGIVKKVFDQRKKGRLVLLGDSFSIPLASLLSSLCESEEHISYRSVKRPILEKILELKPDCVIVLFWIPTINELSNEKMGLGGS